MNVTVLDEIVDWTSTACYNGRELYERTIPPESRISFDELPTDDALYWIIQAMEARF